MGGSKIYYNVIIVKYSNVVYIVFVGGENSFLKLVDPFLDIVLSRLSSPRGPSPSPPPLSPPALSPPLHIQEGEGVCMKRDDCLFHESDVEFPEKGVRSEIRKHAHM